MKEFGLRKEDTVRPPLGEEGISRGVATEEAGPAELTGRGRWWKAPRPSGPLASAALNPSLRRDRTTGAWGVWGEI